MKLKYASASPLSVYPVNVIVIATAPSWSLISKAVIVALGMYNAPDLPATYPPPTLGPN